MPGKRKQRFGRIAPNLCAYLFVLSAWQKEALEKFEECMNEMHSITERDAFSYGFRLGVRLMAEAFLQPIGEDE